MEQPNNEYIDRLSGDDLGFKTRMIAILKRELPEEIALYRDLLRNRDMLEAAQCVHKLKHKISILGLEKGYEMADQFEENLKNAHTTLQSDFEMVLDTMQRFVREL